MAKKGNTIKELVCYYCEIQGLRYVVKNIKRQASDELMLASFQKHLVKSHLPIEEMERLVN